MDAVLLVARQDQPQGSCGGRDYYNNKWELGEAKGYY